MERFLMAQNPYPDDQIVFVLPPYAIKLERVGIDIQHGPLGKRFLGNSGFRYDFAESVIIDAEIGPITKGNPIRFWRDFIH